MALYAIARGRSAFVFAGFAHAACRLRRGLLDRHSRRPSASASRSGWIRGTTACLAATRSRTGCGRCRPGRSGAAGPGLGSRSRSRPAHTDFVLAAIGEKLGFVGVAVVVGLYALLSWRCLRIAARAPGDYTRVSRHRRRAGARRPGARDRERPARAVPARRRRHAVPELRALLDARQLRGGRASCWPWHGGAARSRQHLRAADARACGRCWPAVTLASLAAPPGCRWCMRIDFATASSLSEQADGGYRFEYNPRLIAAAREIERGTMYDRNGLVLATSRPAGNRGARQRATARRGGAPADVCVRGRPLLPAGRRGVQRARRLGHTDQLGGAQLVVSGARQRRAARGLRRSSTRRGRREPADRATRARDQAGLPRAPADRAARTRARRAPTSLRCWRGRAICASSIDARLQVRVATALAKRHRARRPHARRGGGDRRGERESAGVGQLPVAGTGDDGGRTTDRRSDGRAARSRALRSVSARIDLQAARGRGRPAQRIRRSSRRRSPACACRTDGSATSCKRLDAARPRRSDGHRAARRTSTCGTGCRLVQRILRAAGHAASGRSRYSTLPGSSRSTRPGLRPPRLSSDAGPRRLRPGRRAGLPLKMARVAASIAARGVVVPVQWTLATARELTGHGEAGAAIPLEKPTPRRCRATCAKRSPPAPAGAPGRMRRRSRARRARRRSTDGRAHSWFAGFAPYGGAAGIAFAVIVENAGYGARAAAPIAGDIVSAARELGLMK